MNHIMQVLLDAMTATSSQLSGGAACATMHQDNDAAVDHCTQTVIHRQGQLRSLTILYTRHSAIMQLFVLRSKADGDYE